MKGKSLVSYHHYKVSSIFKKKTDKIFSRLDLEFGGFFHCLAIFFLFVCSFFSFRIVLLLKYSVLIRRISTFVLNPVCSRHCFLCLEISANRLQNCNEIN